MGKISKTKTIFWEKAQHVCTVFIKAINKKPFSLATPHLNEAMDQSETPLRLMLRPPLSTKVPFVIFNFVDWTLHGHKAQTKYSHMS